MRAPEFGTSAVELYRSALEMSSWADEHGVGAIVLSEHHCSADGYLPAALTMAAAVAARTSRCLISVNALPLTLHDPVTVAEQLSVVNLIAGGRLAVTVVPGYVPEELAMFGIDPSERGRILDEKLEVLVRLLAGEQCEWRGRSVRITPVTAAPLLFVGGATEAAARRAARFASGFAPTRADRALRTAYLEECDRLGKPRGFVMMPPTPLFVHVSKDPDATWEVLKPHVEHELASYRTWAAHEPHSPYATLPDADAARAAGLWEVATVERSVEIIRNSGLLVLRPLLSGLAPEIGWAGLRLLADEVLPQFG